MTSTRTVSRIARILALIPYVLDKSSVDIEEVKERFNYTQSELTRDLNTILVCGLPGYGPGDLMEGYLDEDDVIIDSADFFSRAPRLTSTEALGLLASGFTVIGSGESSPALESAVKKLASVTMPEVDSALVVDVLEGTEILADMREAVDRNLAVEIVYRSVGREEDTRRTIEPWTVFTTLGRWYVNGYCRLVDEQRTFRVDRIKSSRVLEEHFDPPEEIPEPGVGYTPDRADVSCVIDLDATARWVLEYYPVEVIDEAEERTRIRFHSPNAEVPARLLLRLGGEANLIEGDEVASRVREIAAEIIGYYQ